MQHDFYHVTYELISNLSPGNCIVSGGNQICALKVDCNTSHDPTTTFAFRYGHFKDAEVHDLKSYALVQVTIKPEGGHAEVPLKNFGMAANAKAECEHEVAKRASK